MTNDRGYCLSPGTEVLGQYETPVYADDGVTVLYTVVTLRLRVPVQSPPPPSPPLSRVVLSLIDDPDNRQRKLQADPPGPPYRRLISPAVFDNCPDQFQILINGMLILLEHYGMSVDDDHPPELHLTREQADQIAATREYRHYHLGAPDALCADTRQNQLNELARAGLPLRMETGDWFYGLPVVIIGENESDTPVLVQT